KSPVAPLAAPPGRAPVEHTRRPFNRIYQCWSRLKPGLPRAAQPAMTTRTSLFVTVLTSLSGCMLQTGGGDDEADTSTEFSELDEVVARHATEANHLPNNVPVFDHAGVTTTVSTKGSIDLNNEFFQDLGTNGRRCVSCHIPTAGWTVTPRQLQSVFNATDGGAFDDGFGLAAVFRTNDGSNSPHADVSTLAKRRTAYSMLLKHGV